MANSNGKITAPVRVTDVKQVLGITNNSVSQLCNNVHSKTNPFSKHKPVKTSSANIDRSSNWYKANDGYCGFNIPSTKKHIYSQNEDAVWSYTPPNSTYRLADFIGYSHRASSQWIRVSCPTTIMQNMGFTIVITVSDASDSELRYKDIFQKSPSYQRTGLYLHIQSNSSGSYIEKPISTEPGNYQIQVTAAECRSLGVTVSGNISIHLFALNNSEAIVSVRNSAETTTLWNVRVISNLPYTHLLRLQVVRRDKTSYNYIIQGLYPDLDAISYQGGTFAADSCIRAYKYKGDNVNYLGNEYDLWSIRLPKGEVASGQRYTFPLDYTYEFNSSDTISSCILIWYNSNGTEVARVVKNVFTA